MNLLLNKRLGTDDKDYWNNNVVKKEAHASALPW